jgi:dipeptidyl aminopeptidase/acylaminoacyl peptidase
MPWEASELWIAAFTPEGTLRDARRLAGGPGESVYQPGWSPDGVLYFVSDRDGWWKLYRFNRPDAAGALPVPVVTNPPAGAEFGRPQWVFGTATWAFAGRSRIVTAYTRRGAWYLATLDPSRGTLSNPIADLAPREWLAASGDDVLLVNGSPTRPDAVVRLHLGRNIIDVLRVASERVVEPSFVSVPEAIEFPTARGRTAHAFYYAPRNRDFIAPAGLRPPLIVISHGGPTAAASPTFDIEVQFWTSHGFAVVDVNYGGSSGYGREYRERLNGQWGVVDVEDCIHAARHLAAQGKADRKRMVIRGRSAGGYTTLAALTFYPTVFAAGASYYGISDVEALVHDSHKFESSSLETLVGPYPAMKDVYRTRSPIHYVDRLSCPLILFQGLEDKVVPPSQSERMVDALRAKGLPVVYLPFEGEQHGFRRAETIMRCLREELAFYRRVFG